MSPRRSTVTTKPPPPPVTRDTRREGELALRLFETLFRGPSWHPWRVVTMAWFGLGDLMTDQDMALWFIISGRRDRPFRRLNLAISRGGKTMWLGRFIIPFYLAIRQYHFAPGETGSAIVAYPARDRASVVLDYCAEGLAEIPGVTITRRPRTYLA